jgi:hypothetical protein
VINVLVAHAPEGFLAMCQGSPSNPFAAISSKEEFKQILFVLMPTALILPARQYIDESNYTSLKISLQLNDNCSALGPSNSNAED